MTELGPVSGWRGMAGAWVWEQGLSLAWSGVGGSEMPTWQALGGGI